MDDRVVQFRVGVTVLAALIITGILVLLFGELPSLVRGTYVVYMKFPSAPGVAQDTPVRKSGILIGRVSKVAFAPDNDVLVTANIDGGIELYRDEVARIKSGLLGDAEVEFVPGPKKPLQRGPVKPGDLMAGTVAVDPLQAVTNIEGSLNRAANSLAVAGDEVGKLAKSVNEVLGTNRDQLGRIITETEKTMVLFQSTLGNLNDVVGDEKTKNELKQAVAEMPRLLGQTRDTVAGMQKTMTLAEENLRNMQTFTKALEQRGEGMVNSLAGGANQLESLLGQLNKLSRNLNSREGSFGQLINNPELYNNLNQAALNVKRLTFELQPIVNNVKVFTDKIARHPGVIVTDAVSPGPGLK